MSKPKNLNPLFLQLIKNQHKTKKGYDEGSSKIDELSHCVDYLI